MSDLIQHFEEKRQQMIDMLTELVNIESPSNDKAAVDKLGNFLAQQFESNGASVERHPRELVGDILLAKWNADSAGKPILIVAHMDTVWPTGTLAEQPLRIDDSGRMFGPGVIDEKGGIVVALAAIQGLRDLGQLPQRPIWYMATSDEEIGSHHSRALIEEQAKQCGLVLVVEPPTRDGAVKAWRKGVATYTMRIEGRASHAGNEPEEGINSIIEFAQQALELHALNDYKNGSSVSVTVVNGGTTTNVIPALTEASIDVRMMTHQAYLKLHQAIKNRAPFIPGAKVTIKDGHYRPPMERKAFVIEQAKRIGESIGITVREDGAGGGSDGNFTAAIGIPTLDGLGPEGTGLHAIHEHILVNSLPQRTALFAAILRDWKFTD